MIIFSYRTLDHRRSLNQLANWLSVETYLYIAGAVELVRKFVLSS